MKLLIALLLAATLSAQPRGLKIYISADMEGIGGVVTGEQLGPTGFEYGKARELMTEEVLAAIAAAREAGATEIVVSDSHGNFQNLLIDKLPKDVLLIRGGPRPLAMMQGIDATFHAVLFIGYHSGTTNPAGVRAHTISSARLADVRINGTSMPEAGINAAVAGHFNVPVVMISGDDAAVEEARTLLGAVEGAVVKRSISFHSANTLTPQAGAALIKERVKAGLAKRASLRPHVLRGPVRLDVTFKNYTPAEIAAYLPGVQRITAHAIRFTGRDIVEVSKFIQFLTTYQAGLTP